MAAKNEITFTIRARDLTRGVFRRIRSGFRGLARGATSLRGLLFGGAVAAAGRAFLNFGGSIKAASDNLQIGVERLQSWRKQAKDTANVGAEALFNALQRISRRAGEARKGNTQLIEDFRELGVTFQELRRLSPEDRFLEIADAVQEAVGEGRADEIRDALAAVGDTELARLLPLLVRGSAAIRQETARLAAEGALQNRQQIEEAAKIEAELRQEMMRAQAELARVMAEVMPHLVTVLEGLNEAIGGIKVLKDIYDREGVEGVQRAVGNAVGVSPAVHSPIDTFMRGFRESLRVLENSGKQTARNTRTSGTLQ